MQIGALVLLWCGDCAGVRAFEAPPCLDGHAECPELACLECGGAVVVTSYPQDVDRVGAHPADTPAEPWALARSA